MIRDLSLVMGRERVLIGLHGSSVGYYEDTMNRVELLPLRSKPFPLKLIVSHTSPLQLESH